MDKLSSDRGRFSGFQVLGIVVGVMLLTIVVTFFAIRAWLFPQPFTPVNLDQQEQHRLEQKLEEFTTFAAVAAPEKKAAIPDKISLQDNFNSQGNLTPETYSEKNASREVTISERELNGLLAKNTDLAQKMAIDLAHDLISIRLLLPVDQDFPFMGGKMIRAKTGAEFSYRDGRPVVILKGVSLMGVPIPNAWLGGFKNIDLVQKFGGSRGFWKSFSDGVETIKVQEGELYFKLKE